MKNFLEPLGKRLMAFLFVFSSSSSRNFILSQSEPQKAYSILRFDDGYKSVINVAYPILKRYGIKGVIGINTGLLGIEGRMSWADIKKLKREGWEIAVHTHSHFSPDDYVQYERQVLKSKRILEEITRDEVVTFIYPYGAVDPLKRIISKDFKVALASGVEGLEGINTFPLDIFAIRAIYLLSEKKIDSIIKEQVKEKGLVVWYFHEIRKRDSIFIEKIIRSSLEEGIEFILPKDLLLILSSFQSNPLVINQFISLEEEQYDTSLLAKNGNFSQWIEGLPSNWNFEKIEGKIFKGKESWERNLIDYDQSSLGIVMRKGDSLLFSQQVSIIGKTSIYFDAKASRSRTLKMELKLMKGKYFWDFDKKRWVREERSYKSFWFGEEWSRIRILFSDDTTKGDVTFQFLVYDYSEAGDPDTLLIDEIAIFDYCGLEVKDVLLFKPDNLIFKTVRESIPPPRDLLPFELLLIQGRTPDDTPLIIFKGKRGKVWYWKADGNLP